MEQIIPIVYTFLEDKASVPLPMDSEGPRKTGLSERGQGKSEGLRERGQGKSETAASDGLEQRSATTCPVGVKTSSWM